MESSEPKLTMSCKIMRVFRIAILIWIAAQKEAAFSFSTKFTNKLSSSFKLMSSQQSMNYVSSSSNVDQEYAVAVLGDLHLDPRDMKDHESGRDHILKVLATKSTQNTCIVSLGDLGESKSVDETTQLFSGTSSCFRFAKKYLDSFGHNVEVVTGNHDLEGIDEFNSDQENLDSFLHHFQKPAPYFKRLLTEKTMLIGLSSVTFRDALYTSHEVFIDDEQVKWFEKTVQCCPAEEGWTVIVFSHAPPMGSGLRVLQENHVVNGCCWLNHSGRNCRKFIEIVRGNPSIKVGKIYLTILYVVCVNIHVMQLCKS